MYDAKELSNTKPIRILPPPEEVVIPLKQHSGATCKPLVKRGDEVLLGQKIADSDAFVSAPIHASVSGVVKAIEARPCPTGGTIECIVITNDGQDRLSPDLPAPSDIDQLSKEEILQRIREAGIVGLGGGGFPTHVKLSPPKDKTITTLILNGAECEPYLTADHRLMVERPEDVIYGARAMAKVLGANEIYIGVELNKPDAIAALRKAAEGTQIQIVGLEVKYPQGAEKQLIYSIVGKQVPTGGLPADVGVIVNNVGTAAAVAQTIKTGKPLYERIVTVSGEGIAEPQNFLVRIGTPFSTLIAAAGGTKGTPRKIIMGGPMTGFTQFTAEVPVIKCTSGVLVFTDQKVAVTKEDPCIKCGRCVDVCPQGLVPCHLARMAATGMLEQAAAEGLLNCVECGACSFVCPAHRFLVQNIKLGKQEVIAKRREQAS